jgi:hypothetical protein
VPDKSVGGKGAFLVKKIIVGVAAIALSLPIVAAAQDSTKQNDSQTSQGQQSQSQTSANQNQANSKNDQMSGKVSSNGKTFTNDSDSKKYKVNNPDALKGYEDQHVAVIVHVDPDTGTLHIIQVAPPQ